MHEIVVARVSLNQIRRFRWTHARAWAVCEIHRWYRGELFGEHVESAQLRIANHHGVERCRSRAAEIPAFARAPVMRRIGREELTEVLDRSGVLVVAQQ